MSKRAIWSIIFIAIGLGAVLINRGMIGALIGGFFFVLMLFLWVIPGDSIGGSRKIKRPNWKPLSLAFLGIGLGLIGSIAAVLLLPPQVFPWVMMAVGIGIIIWFFIYRR